jgi:hypothetical protein
MIDDPDRLGNLDNILTADQNGFRSTRYKAEELNALLLFASVSGVRNAFR